ncbi:MAG: hydrolase 2, exosortase A system-associated [Rugosibacter sp.]|nr:MAG: hydrolase 2, exosortase A system-associated [Rugosibacter sp.]
MTLSVTMQPFSLDVSGRSRFCLYHPPRRVDAVARGAIVYIHPFAEEMNFSRRMVALQARMLAAQGYAVLQIDLSGCGDSAGDFSEARWSAWVADIIAAARWTQSHRIRHNPIDGTEPLIFWGLRAGCLLATEAASALDEPVDFLFWQPVLSGEAYWRQFRRLEVAARALENYGNTRENQAARVAENTPAIEIAGYCISSELIAGLSAAQLVLPANTRRVSCVELKPCSGAEQGNTHSDSLSSTLTAAVAAWREQGTSVRCAVVPGAAFWQIAEAEDCPALRTATAQLLMEGSDDDA